MAEHIPTTNVNDTEYEWECVELVKRYMYLAYGIPAYFANGNAVVDNYLSYNINPILQPVPNDGKSHTAPVPGDVLSYGNASPGHTALVIDSTVNASGVGTLTVMEQNFNASGTATLDVGLNKKAWVVTDKRYASSTAIKNWLHHTLDVSPQVGPSPSLVDFSGSGFAPNESITINLDTTFLAFATASKSGTFSATIAIPTNIAPGPHSLGATGQKSGATGKKSYVPHTVFYVSAPPTPTATPTPTPSPTPTPVGPVTYYVAPTGNDSSDCRSPSTACLTVGAAIGKANSGDTISIAASSTPYYEHITISANLTITGAGPGLTTIGALGSSPSLVMVPTGVTTSISGVTIQGASSDTLCPNSVTLHCGGGIYNSGILTLSNSFVSNNGANVGGGIYNVGTLTLKDSIVSGNLSGNGSGGGILNEGGFNNSGSMTIIDSTISGNTAVDGGGILNNGSLLVSTSTISGNTATDDGGGIYSNINTVSLINSTISGNSSAEGGGILISPQGAVDLVSSTISANTVIANGGPGGGIANFNRVRLWNTILAGNTAALNFDPDCYTLLPLISYGYNLLGDSTGCLGLTDGVNGDQVSESPQLGPLQYNGGPTQTMALLQGSPAIDAGNPSGCTDDSQSTLLTTDQRGFTRPYPIGGRCDIGAYEYGASGPNSSVAATHGSPRAIARPHQ